MFHICKHALVHPLLLLNAIETDQRITIPVDLLHNAYSALGEGHLGGACCVFCHNHAVAGRQVYNFELLQECKHGPVHPLMRCNAIEADLCIPIPID